MTIPHPPRYSIEICSSAQEKLTHADDIQAYYELRRRVYVEKAGRGQEKYYGQYPTPEDNREDTAFLIFKTTDATTGEQKVFGGRRIVFRSATAPDLPLEQKHDVNNLRSHGNDASVVEQHISKLLKLHKNARFGGFSALLNKPRLELSDIVPAATVRGDITFAEIGAFAIDQDITRAAFSRDEYKALRDDIYRNSLELAARKGTDIVLVDAGRNNREHQEEWLRSTGAYEYRHLGRTGHLFGNPFSGGNETEMLVINVSNRFSLSRAESVLRFNQQAAELARQSSAGR